MENQTEQQKKDAIRKIVVEFTREYVDRHLRWQIGQIIPGADAKIPDLPHDDDQVLSHTMEPQLWLDMALWGAGLSKQHPGKMHDVCQSLAEWLFAIPGLATYHIPDLWYQTPMGALWAQALLKCSGDELITIAQAAQVAGVSTQAISQRVDRGTLKVYIDPLAPERQGRKLVRRSDVERGERA